MLLSCLIPSQRDKTLCQHPNVLIKFINRTANVCSYLYPFVFIEFFSIHKFNTSCIFILSKSNVILIIRLIKSILTWLHKYSLRTYIEQEIYLVGTYFSSNQVFSFVYNLRVNTKFTFLKNYNANLTAYNFPTNIKSKTNF